MLIFFIKIHTYIRVQRGGMGGNDPPPPRGVRYPPLDEPHGGNKKGPPLGFSGIKLLKKAKICEKIDQKSQIFPNFG